MENLDHDWIKLNTGAKEHSCKCSACKNMCETSPCLGTPGDILKIIKAGFGSQLAVTEWAAGIFYGQPVITMVQALQLKTGCTFYENGKCKLHDLDLKPIEGRLANHNLIGFKLPYVVARTWLFKRNDETLTQIAEGMIIKNKN